MNPWKVGILGFLSVVVIIAICGAIAVGSPFWGAFVAKKTAGARVTQQVYDPNNIVGQVYFFTQTCNDVSRDYANWKANEADYQQQIALASSATTQAEQTEAQNNAEQYANYVAGALANLQADAADYNARSENYTANPFKSAGLPYRITVPSDPSQLSTWVPPNCG